ncbi:sorting assembly machinery 50 kDa subunit, putative [Hepatocystis sp. ex Piliocolobus tephrosceles]|nr:sorting assembly machinery 50 kDa subunit, putative [Hepatocystis sp. ex Piliocolobus tephrosceles]
MNERNNDERNNDESNNDEFNDVTVNLKGVKKIKKKNLDFLFVDIKKSRNIDELVHNINKCNNQINYLNIFDGIPRIFLSNSVDNNVIVNYNMLEKKSNYMIGTHVNNRGEVTLDLEMAIPYLFKTINSLEFKANFSSLYTNSFGTRFVIPQIPYNFQFLKNSKLFFEWTLSSINHTKTTSYALNTNSLKTHFLKNNNSFIWEFGYNKIFKKIDKNFINCDKILKSVDSNFKHSIRHIHKKDKLVYTLSDSTTLNTVNAPNNNDTRNENIQTTPYPRGGYYYNIDTEISLPYCEQKFIKNMFNFLYVKKIKNNFFSYIQFSNGMKWHYDDFNTTKYDDEKISLNTVMNKTDYSNCSYNLNQQIKHKTIDYLNNFNFTGSVGISEMIFRGFEYNSMGPVENCYKFNKEKKKYDLHYNYLGTHFFTNIQLIFKYIFKFQNLKPIAFFYIQVGRLSDYFYHSFDKFKNDFRISIGTGLTTFIQKNISLEVFFNYPLLYHMTDKTKFFQVGLNFKAVM